MHYLTLVRHAKSSWKHPELADHDRPLNKRGRHDLPLMTARLRGRLPPPDLMLCSTAVRARTTAVAIAEAWRPTPPLERDASIYLADLGTLLEIVGDLDDRFEHVLMVGHNPGFTELANALGDREIENLPTCGVYSLELPLDHWAALAGIQGHLRLFDYPKRGATEGVGTGG